MTKKLIFRADGNSRIGLGHLYRLMSLVEIAKNEFQFVFITRNNLAKGIIPENYTTAYIPDSVTIANEPQWLADNFQTNQSIVIADGYQFNSKYQKDTKDLGFKLIYIDDLASEYMYADIVINHSPYFSQKHFKAQPYTKFALGTKFALLRTSFMKCTETIREVHKVTAAFVCFGGADALNLSYTATGALLTFTQFTSIHIVLGAAYKHDEIFKLKSIHPNRIFIYQNLTEEALLQVMNQCNFGIVPASTILYELCCVKMPILSGFFVDNQELIYSGFLNKNAIFNGGNFKNYSTNNFVEKIEETLKINDYSFQTQAQSKLFDSYIKSRHLKLIKSLC